MLAHAGLQDDVSVSTIRALREVDAAMARNTGATVIVPIYPLVPQGGTAGTVVPAMADLISSQIDQHGAENVSVYGDSLAAP